MNFELLSALTRFQDPHFSVNLFEYYESQDHQTVFDKKQLNHLKLQNLLKTKIFDHIQKELTQQPSQNHLNDQVSTLKKQTEEKVAQLVGQASQFITFIDKKGQDLEKDRYQKTAFLKYPEFELITRDQLVAAAQYSHYMYDLGQYAESFRICSAVQHLLPEEQTISTLYGKLLCEIHLKMNLEAKDDMKTIRQLLENSNLLMVQQRLAYRVNLMHTALQLYLNPMSQDQDYEELIDLYSSENFFNAIQITAPHLIRYLTACLLLSKNAQRFGNFNIRSLAQVLKSNVINYNDKLTQFVNKLLVDFDFQAAKECLKEFQNELQHDYYLSDRVQEIIKNAQSLLFETYCQLFKQVEIPMIAEFLKISEQDAEIWIVNQIKNSDIRAKIDSDKKLVYITKSVPDFYEKVNNKTRDLLPRTTLLVNNIKRIIQTKHN